MSAVDKLREILEDILIYPMIVRTYKQLYRALDGECGIPKTQTNWRFWDRFSWSRQRTPEGAGVIAKDRIPDKAKRNIDIGLKNMLAQHNHRFPNWNKLNKVSDYTIVFVDKNFVNVETDPGSPAISRKGLHTAGTTLGATLGPTSLKIKGVLVVPHQFDTDWNHLDYLMHTIWNEGEHQHEYANDPYGEFVQHAIVQDVHPHYFSDEVPVIPAEL